MPTAIETATVTFHSRHPNHLLVRKCKDSEFISGVGERVTQKSVKYQFEQGVLTVTGGKDRLVDNPGWLRDDEDPDAERDVVEALRAHREFNRDFWEKGYGPGTILPRPPDYRADLMAAVANLDEDAIVTMLSEERAGRLNTQGEMKAGRPDLIRETEQALESVRSARATLEAKIASGDAENAPKGAKK